MQVNRISVSVFLSIILFVSVAANLLTNAVGYINTDKDESFTHTVFAEYSSLSYCGYCPAASSQLYEIYSSENYPFLYVTLVADKNEKARDRCTELGVTGFPTVYFDGGFTHIVGQQGSTTPYINAITECGERDDVYDVNIDVSMRDKGNSRLMINISIKNNEPRVVYTGILRAYMTEIVSHWNDASGKPYHFAMLDYAYNEPVSIDGSVTLNLSRVWDGSEYNLDVENIMVVAALYDSHTGYVDNAAYATIYSDSPDTFISSGPQGIINETTVTFTWTGKDKHTPTSELLYSYRLEPYESTWSEWSPATAVTYTGLTEGWYQFNVKAKNSKGEEDPKPVVSSFAVNTHNPPKVEIKKPGKFLYVNNKILPIPLPFVVGDVDIEVTTSDEAGIDHVEFYVNGVLKLEDHYPPYRCTTWHETGFFKRFVIKAVAYDTLGNHAADEVTIWKIF
ncbi:MAG: hypothetical protein J7L32_03065 [Thermoplasmata archaeon]|nr:hypothetical protein [Thermoplasmata archaeon]